MTQELTLMQAAIDKMRWHEANQKVLARNIANADTPGYKAEELKPVDFHGLLNSSASPSSISVATTNAHHLTSGGAQAGAAKPVVKTQKDPYEVSPSGNAVVIEEQLLKMNQNYTDHRLTTTIYQKQVDMLKSATK